MSDSIDTVDVLQALADDNFRIGRCQNLVYDRNSSPRIFPDEFLSTLYLRAKSAHILHRTFCGFTDQSHDAVVNYLTLKSVTVPVIWNPTDTAFDIAGFSYIVEWVGAFPSQPGPRSAFAGYAFFPEYWGTPEISTLAMLGMARMFHAYKLQSLFGQRYSTNVLTARFMARFGFRDIVRIPGFIKDRRGTEMVLSDCDVSMLTRAYFVAYVERRLMEMLDE